jgi:hypothetical protein
MSIQQDCLLNKFFGIDCGIGTAIFLLFILFVAVISIYLKAVAWTSNCECVMANIKSSKSSPEQLNLIINFWDKNTKKELDISHTADIEYFKDVNKRNGIIYNFRTKDITHRDKDIEVDYLGENVDEWPKPTINDDGDLVINDTKGMMRTGSISVLSNKRRLVTKVINR